MNINCVICSDLVTPQGENYVTPCGHMFHYNCLINWLKRSKTCPQCRNKTTTSSIHRIYFNLSSSEGVSQDASVLQYKIDNLEFQIKLKEKELQNYKEKYKKAKIQSDGLRAEVARLEDTERINNSTMLVLKDQINYYKKKTKEVEKLNEDIFQLRQKIKDMEHIETAMKGSRQDVENILANESNIESLALLASTLKKSLVDSESKRRNLQFQLKQAVTAHSSCNKNISELRSESEALNKLHETTKLHHEKEVKFLKDKYEQLCNKLSSNDQLSQSVNNSIQRILLESPVNCNTPILKGKSNNLEESSTPVVNMRVLGSKPNVFSAGSHLSHLTKQSSSSTIISNTQNQSTRLEGNKYSFLARSQKLTQKLAVKPSEMVYDGLGGSYKEDLFPQPDKAPRPLKRPKTSAVSAAKLKKLSPSAGQKKKVLDFFSQ